MFSEIMILKNEGKLNKALERLNSLYSNDNNSLDEELLFNYGKIKAEILLLLGRYEEAIDFLKDQLHAFSDRLEKKHRIELLILLVKGLARAHRVDEAKDSLNDMLLLLFSSKTVLSIIEEKKYMGLTFFLRAMINYVIRDYDSSEDLLLNSLSFFEEVAYLDGMGNAYNLLGLVYWNKGDLSKAIDFFYKGLEAWEKTENKIRIAIAYHNLGDVYLSLGEFSKALYFLEKSLVLKKNFQLAESLAVTLNSIGTVYYYRGDYENAFDNFKRVLELKGVSSRSRIWALNNIGLVFHAWNDLEKAENYFVNALKIAEALDDNLSISLVTHNLVLLELDKDEEEKSLFYLRLLEKVSSKDSRLIVLHRFLLAKALFLKQLGNEDDVYEAKKIFEKVALDTKTSETGLKLLAVFNLCDLLFKEIEEKKERDEELLEELKKWIMYLKNFSIKENSVFYLIQSHLLEAELYLIQGDFEKTKELLADAQVIAENKGLLNLAIKVSNQVDLFLKEYSTLNKKNRSALSLDESKKNYLPGFKDLLNNALIRQTVSYPAITSEKAISFLIISIDGKIIFWERFEEFPVEDRVIQHFIDMMLKAGKELFGKLGFVERFVFDDYTILFKKVKGLIFSYVIKGSSFSGIHKLNSLVDIIQLQYDLWEKLLFNRNEIDDASAMKLRYFVHSIIVSESHAFRSNSGKSFDGFLDQGGAGGVEEFVPKELLSFKNVFHPAKIAILKIMSVSIKMSASELRQLIGIPWGNLDTHLKSLEKQGILEERIEFSQNTPRRIIYITDKGNEIYNRLKSILKSML